MYLEHILLIKVLMIGVLRHGFYQHLENQEPNIHQNFNVMVCNVSQEIPLLLQKLLYLVLLDIIVEQGLVL
jgi:hypothetical protein